jgi:hypothetical protein
VSPPAYSSSGSVRGDPSDRTFRAHPGRLARAHEPHRHQLPRKDVPNSSARLPSEFTLSTLTLTNYIKVWIDPSTYEILWDTLLFAGGSTLFCFFFAASLAWLSERTDMPGRIWIYAGLPMTLAMPGMLQAMAWTLLASPRVGFLNKGFMAALNLQSAPFNIHSLTGMIFVEGLLWTPIALLDAAAAELLLGHREAFARQTAAILAERARLERDLDGLRGAERFASAANFILVRLPDGPGAFEALRQRGILVRTFHGTHPLLANCLRLTVGTPDENTRMLEALAAALG